MGGCRELGMRLVGHPRSACSDSPRTAHKTSYVDLLTVHGLKKLYKNFEEMMERLDLLLRFAARMGIDALVGGVVAVYTRMCVDSILCAHLFREGSELMVVSLSPFAV
jgi:hypothetical protein